MKLIVCVDDNGGMLFNKRRISRDRVLCQHIIKMAKGANLWVNAYSRDLFSETDCNIPLYCGENHCIAKEDYLFAEDLAVEKLLPLADTLILYRWNRRYPSDVKFPLELLGQWKLVSACDFPGSSHEKITCEVYCK